MNWKVPLFDLYLGEEEIAAVEAVLRSRWLTMGDRTREFEEQFAAYTGARHAIAVNSCTAALHMSMATLDLGPGDEVICPSLTFVATANAIRYTGATPVFADITSPENLNISPQSIESLISERTRAICVVHFAGYPCDMESILAIAAKHGVEVVEDCAHSIGASINDVATGRLGASGCFSFFSNKNMTTGEGGMLITDRDDLAERAKRMRSHAMTTLTLDRHKGRAYSYDVDGLGYNYRLTEIQAALGIEQLKRVPGWNRQRGELVAAYREALGAIDGLIVPFAANDGVSAYHILPVILPQGTDRKAVMEALKNDGVQSSIHYPPVHLFSAFGQYADAHLPITMGIAERELTLPLFASMSADQVDLVVKSLQAALQ